MSILDELRNDARLKEGWQHSRLYALLAGVIVIALILVSVAMSIYNSSGAAQIDMSRPGFSSVQNKVKEDTSTQSFPASGQFDQQAFKDFYKMYDERVTALDSINAYDPAATENDSYTLLPPENQPQL